MNFQYLELKRVEEQSYFLFVQFVKDYEGRNNLSYTVINFIAMYIFTVNVIQQSYSKHLSMSLMSCGPIANHNPKQ